MAEKNNNQQQKSEQKPESNTSAADSQGEQQTKAKAASGQTSAAKGSAKGGAKGAAKGKKKEPSVEDKPFADFMHQDYLPALKEALMKEGLEDIELNLTKQKVSLFGANPKEDCWQVVGRWNQGKRQFRVYFPKADIQGVKGFSCSDSSSQASTIEPFLIDDRKVSLQLLVFGVIQRLNAQKWLARN
ncbi:DUF2996 domain-containing protein [Geitlerinema sp. PCC 9228]|jgi:hypothetical protein|uniref:DUF2996 domain-containing protein n=1 Tax=Geitlerinema sp. PCC 9228 TaxID=111611 RepID=UPI0008F98F2D|nr:DUF2996 domain-containing protein [Geitlerinema sp. PCC 9228]